MRAPGNSLRRSPSAASSAATRSRWCCPMCRRCWKRTTASPWPARCSTPINTRLDAAIIGFTLDHGEAKVLITDREFSKVVKDALGACKAKPLVIDYDDPEFTGAGERLGNLEYEDFLREGDRRFRLADAAATNGTPSRSITPRAPPAIPRASSITTAALICSRWPMSSPAAWASIRSICGRCRCSTATAGAFRGRCRSSPARMCACARCARRRSTTPSPRTRSRICAARRS